jgi:hypothetical protein
MNGTMLLVNLCKGLEQANLNCHVLAAHSPSQVMDFPYKSNGHPPTTLDTTTHPHTHSGPQEPLKQLRALKWAQRRALMWGQRRALTWAQRRALKWAHPNHGLSHQSRHYHTSQGLPHQSRTVTPVEDCHTSQGPSYQSRYVTAVKDCHTS